MAVSGQELSECTSHLVEYAANRGFSRITQIARIIGGVMVVGGNCLRICRIYGIKVIVVQDLGWYYGRSTLQIANVQRIPRIESRVIRLKV